MGSQGRMVFPKLCSILLTLGPIVHTSNAQSTTSTTALSTSTTLTATTTTATITTTTLPPTTTTATTSISSTSSTTSSSSTSSTTSQSTTSDSTSPMSTSPPAAESTTSSWTLWSSPFVPSDNMDFEWFLKEFLLQCAVNLFCILIILLAIWIYIEFWMKPVQRPQTPAPVKAAVYEEEIEKIKLDLATISTTYMRSKWRSEANEVEEEEVEGQEKAEEETEEEVEEEVEEVAKAENDEPDVDDQGKEEDTVIDIE